MTERLGLFENYLLRHPISDEFRASLVEEITALAEFIGQGGEHVVGVASRDDPLGDEKVNQSVCDGEAEVTGLTAARFGA